jgi:hypothetical protein
MNYQNNPTVVKKSVHNTLGYYHHHYKWIWRPQPYTTVKPDHTRNINNQENYIKQLSNKVVLCSDLSNNLIQQKPCISNKLNKSINLMEHIIYAVPPTNNITKPPIINKTSKHSYRAGLDASEHIQLITNTCQINDVFTIPNNKKNMVFACPNSH